MNDAVCGEERGRSIKFLSHFPSVTLTNFDYDRKYNAFGRTYLFNIDGYHLQEEEEDWDPKYVVDAYHAGNVSFPSFLFCSVTDLATATMFPQFTRFLVSSLHVKDHKQEADIPIQNHSCEPNCMILCCYINDGDMEKPLLTVFTLQDVEAWGELSFSYSGVSDEDVDVAVCPSEFMIIVRLLMLFGIGCRCD